MLTVLATATSDALTTLENAKEFLGVTDSKDDQFIDRLILRASRRITTYLGRPLVLQTYQTLLPSQGSVNLLLPRYPIQTVLRLFDSSDTGSAQAVTQYRVDREAGLLNRDAGWSWTVQLDAHAVTDLPTPGGEYRTWLVEWSAGYIGPNGTSSTGHGNTSTGSTLPEDLEEACLELIKDRYLARSRSDAVQSEKVGDVSVTYRDGGSQQVPMTVAALLAPYQSVV
jgi:hypothetical protein